ncbi:unnamed protein product [Caenorhabditis auriculariae]|uniref:Transmembrane protein INAFM2 n=1 Tax=Caenorhabditis auriculariae TaxID=2777116 RepID=A0A8S1GVX4_9PELO|nr:unnamed protein product [Caenorhabditis auriculariae]
MRGSGGEWMSVEDLIDKISQRSRKMSTPNNNITTYSARMRGRSKQPIYTSDKRAKFTQKENKKWVRFVTVLGYIISVSLPAISLSFYYLYVWDPSYIAKFPPENVSRTMAIHKTPILPTRNHRDVETTPAVQPSAQAEKIELAKILREGRASMENSGENG